VAELEIYPAQLDAYRAAVSEEIDDSIRLEPGVVAIYSVALKDAPEKLRFFEIYADAAAYRQHIASPHFRKYVDVTKEMIAGRRLLETESHRLYIKAP
jgi:quinol monooxygenase YgiN